MSFSAWHYFHGGKESTSRVSNDNGVFSLEVEDARVFGKCRFIGTRFRFEGNFYEPAEDIIEVKDVVSWDLTEVHLEDPVYAEEVVCTDPLVLDAYKCKITKQMIIDALNESYGG